MVRTSGLQIPRYNAELSSCHLCKPPQSARSHVKSYLPRVNIGPLESHPIGLAVLTPHEARRGPSKHAASPLH